MLFGEFFDEKLSENNALLQIKQVENINSISSNAI